MTYQPDRLRAIPVRRDLVAPTGRYARTFHGLPTSEFAQPAHIAFWSAPSRSPVDAMLHHLAVRRVRDHPDIGPEAIPTPQRTAHVGTPPSHNDEILICSDSAITAISPITMSVGRAGSSRGGRTALPD